MSENSVPTMGNMRETPMGKRLDAFLDGEWKKGNGLTVSRSMFDQFLRFAEAETEILERKIEQLRQDVEGLKRELRSYR